MAKKGDKGDPGEVTQAEFDALADDVSDLNQAISDIEPRVDSLETDKADVIISSASGSIASFHDGAEAPVKSLTVDIEPVQDLHGYDHPWPAGGGVNLLNSDGYSFTTETGTDKTYIIDKQVYLEAGVTYTFSCRQTGNAGTAIRNLLGVANSVSTVSLAWETSNIFTAHVHTVTFTPTESGNYRPLYWAHTLENAVTLDEFQCEKGSAFTSYAPYSNICPISGWTGAKVTRTGKNFFDSTKVTLDRRIDITNGNAVGVGSNDFWVSDYTPVIGGETYTLNFSYHSSANYGAAYYDDQKAFISGFRTGQATGTNPFTFTVPNNAKYIRFTSHIPNTRPIAEIQLELGSTATAYEPYQGQTYDITFPSEAGTVYGGTLTVNEDGTGRLVVDMAIVTITKESILAAAKEGHNIRINTNNYDLPKFKAYNGGYCDKLIYATSWSAVTNTPFSMGCNYPKGRQIIINESVGTTLDEIKDFVGDDGLHFVTYLEEPITYQLTPTEITTLLGTNNMWSDAGDVKVEYRADTKLYIQQLTKPTEDDMTANVAIQSEKFFMIGNRLFLATSAIASGAMIIPGTNCTELSLADALNNINA